MIEPTLSLQISQLFSDPANKKCEKVQSLHDWQQKEQKCFTAQKSY